MFEVGMSALVLKICSEYAKALGLNFPPCTQQEINAICEWVDKHTIKDMTISQNGYNVTFTFKTENDVTKEFTFTIPKKVDVDELEKVLIGSDSVVVERLEDNSGLRVRLAQSVLNNINNKLTKPANPTSDSVVTMNASGTVGTKLLSEIGGGGKVYRHNISIYLTTTFTNSLLITLYSTSNITYDKDTFPNISCVCGVMIDSGAAKGAGVLEKINSSWTFIGMALKASDSTVVPVFGNNEDKIMNFIPAMISDNCVEV